MKAFSLSVAALGLFFVTATTASAGLTCAQQAHACMGKCNKSNCEALCNGPVAACKQTCVYVGPSGRSWPATDCKRASK